MTIELSTYVTTVVPAAGTSFSTEGVLGFQDGSLKKFPVVQIGPLSADANLAPNAAAVVNALSLKADTSAVAELSMDALAAAFAAGTHSNITITYNDAANAFSFAASGSGGGSSSPLSTTFTTAIQLDSFRTMGEVNVTTDTTLTFNSAGAADGSELTVDFVTDGSHDIVFDPLFVLVGPQDIDNTAGRINMVTFWRRGGINYYAVALGAFRTRPTLLSAVIENATPSVVTLTYSRDLYGTLAAASAFTVSGSTISLIAAGSTASVVKLTLSAAVAAGASKTLGYTVPVSNPLRDSVGNTALAVTGMSIVNNVVAAATTSFVQFTEVNNGNGVTGNSTVGWTYSGYGGDFDSNTCGTPSKSLAASADGYVQTKIWSALAGPGQRMGFHTTAPAGNSSTFAFFISAYGGDHWGTDVYYRVGMGSSYEDTSFLTAQNDVIRLERVGTTMLAKVASAATPTVFTTIKTWTGVTSAQLYPGLNFQTGADGPQYAGPIVGGNLT